MLLHGALPFVNCLCVLLLLRATIAYSSANAHLEEPSHRELPGIASFMTSLPRNADSTRRESSLGNNIKNPTHEDYIAAISPWHTFAFNASQGILFTESPVAQVNRIVAVDGPIQCGEGRPCADKSCCNSEGKCGFGKGHCSPDAPLKCLSNCNAKAMCGVDSDGGKEKCGLNLCCSHYGWCGTEEVHCVNADSKGLTAPCQKDFGGCKVVPPPSCGTSSGTTNGRKIAYYQSWNMRKRSCNRVSPSQINTNGLSHLYFAFASIDPSSFKVVPADPSDEKLYTEFSKLKSSTLATWIAVGGFDFSDPGPTRTTWSDMASNAGSRGVFIQSLIAFMDKYGFQGVDIDWEYPATPERGGRPADTHNLVSLVKEMRNAFGNKYGISSILAPDYWYLRGMDPKAMEPYVNWFGFMAYDLHGSWDADINTLGSSIRPQTDMREIEKDLLPLWFDNLNPSKVNFGLAYYGRGYTVSDPSCKYMGCQFKGASAPAGCTNIGGVMSNREIQQLIETKKLAPELLKEPMVKQIAWDDQWIGYDDQETIGMKIRTANNRCLGGTMIWAIDYDSGAGSGDTPDSGGQNDSGAGSGDDEDSEGKDNTNKGEDHENGNGDYPWKNISCTIPAVADMYSGESFEDRWKDIQAEVAFKTMISDWRAYRDGPIHIDSFSVFASNFFKGRTGMECGIIASYSNCDETYQCVESADVHPANWGILNSMVAIHEMHLNVWRTLQDVQGDMLTQISDIQGTFAPAKDNTKALKIALDIAALAYGLIAAPVWNIAFKNTPFFATRGNELGSTKDATNAAVASTVVLIKDGLVAGAALAAQNDVAHTLGQLVTVSTNAVDTLNNHIFNGTNDAIDLLHSMIKDGKFMVGLPADAIDAIAMGAAIKRPFLGAIIPHLWSTEHAPFVMDTKKTCDKQGNKDGAKIDSDEKPGSFACVDNTLYYLATTRNSDATICAISTDCHSSSFEALPGVKTLDGTQWGGVTLEDIITGAVRSYQANGNQNGWAQADPAADALVVENIVDIGVRTPGVVMIPVCTQDEARENWDNFEPKNTMTPHYPCN